MNIQNPQGKPLPEVLARLAVKYPGSEIKKPVLTPETIIAPFSNYKFLVRNKKGYLKVDFTPPVLWVIGAVILSAVFLSAILSAIYGQFVFGIGGALWIVLAILVVKAIFKSRNRDQFNKFYTDVREAVDRDNDSAIF